jgi:geranylgeranyl diphosphate synthase, type II
LSQEIKALQEKIASAVAALEFPVQPADLYDPIRYTLELGGKRMRPALALMGCSLFSRDLDAALKPALGVEVFHNFTLLHDDIMDNAPLRRNKPTVYSKWNTNVAILSGDVMFAESFRLVSEAPSQVLKPVIDVFLKAAIEVCEGQQWDMDFESRNDVSIPEYLNMIRFKTAVLLGASLQMGALCGGSSNEDAQLLYDFGCAVGVAFQIQDDVLDVYGDPDKFGKQVGGDIISNKKTWLKLRALEKANNEQLAQLSHYYSGAAFDPVEKVNSVRAIFDATGVKEEAETLMQQYLHEALDSLHQVNASESHKAILEVFARELMQRQF